jgi:hypothetical protein
VAEPLLARAYAIFDKTLPSVAAAEAPPINRFSRPD